MITFAPFPESNSIVFLDMHALTRLTLPGKVKSVLDYAEYGDGGFTKLSDSLLVASGKNSSKLISMPAMTSAGSIRSICSRGYGLSPDGQWVYLFFPFVSNTKLSRADSMSCYRFPTAEVNERNIVQRNRFAIGEATYPVPLPALDLGGTNDALPTFRAVWPDGRFVVADTGGLLCGTVAQREFAFRWWLPIHHDLDTCQMQWQVEGDNVWLTGLARDQNHTVVVCIHSDGSAQTWRFDAIEAPAVHDGAVGLCTAPGTLVWQRLDDPDSRKSFTLPAEHLALQGGVEPDTVRVSPLLARSAPPDLRGQVLVLSGALVYVPWHGEVLFNLSVNKASDQVIPRKLAAAGFPQRSFESRAASRLRAAMGEAGVSLNLAHRSCFDEVARPRGMKGLCANGMLLEYWAHHGRKPPARQIITVQVTRPITAADVREGTDLLTRHGFSAVDLLVPIHTLMENAGKPLGALFTPEARSLVAEAILSAAVGQPPSETPIHKTTQIKARLASGTNGHIPKMWNGTELLVPVLKALLG